MGSSSDITQQNRNSDLTVVLQVKRTLPCKTQELHLKPRGAEGAALFGVLIFCLLPLLIGPCSGPSAEISLVTSYNSPLPAAGSNGAGDISITSTEQEGKKKPKQNQQSADIHPHCPIRVLSRSAISAAVSTFRRAPQRNAGSFVLHCFSSTDLSLARDAAAAAAEMFLSAKDLLWVWGDNRWPSPSSPDGSVEATISVKHITLH